MSSPADQQVVDAFHCLFHRGPGGGGAVWTEVAWPGVPALKCPFDLCIYQEILHETRPELIIECGV